MRTIVRALALLAPVAAVLLVGAAYQSGAMTQKHVSPVKAIGLVVVVFLVSWLVLQVTRKKPEPQKRPTATDWRIVPAGRRGRR